MVTPPPTSFALSKKKGVNPLLTMASQPQISVKECRYSLHGGTTTMAKKLSEKALASEEDAIGYSGGLMKNKVFP
jgi:hypothetical protein